MGKLLVYHGFIMTDTKTTHAITKGFRFLHKTWKSPAFSFAQYKELPTRETAQEFIVTRIAKGTCYYRPVYRIDGEIRNYGSPFYRDLAKMSEVILEVLD
jgi:hypothetical protein